MHTFERGQAVSVLNSPLTGTITDISSDGKITVTLDSGGTIQTTADNLSPASNNNGRFQDGHPYHPANPEHEELKANAKDIQQNMLSQLAPIFKKVGTYIDQIQSPERKINAISKLAPYVLPALSRVEFTDETPRNLTEEQKLEEYIRQKREKEQTK